MGQPKVTIYKLQSWVFPHFLTQRLHRGPLPLLTPICTFECLHLPLCELVETTEWTCGETSPPLPFSHHPDGLHSAGVVTGQKAASRIPLPPQPSLLLLSSFGGILPAISWWPHGANALSHCRRNTGKVTTEGDHRAGELGLSRKKFPFERLSRGCSSYMSRIPSALPKLFTG